MLERLLSNIYIADLTQFHSIGNLYKSDLIIISMKKAQITVFVIIAIFLVAGILLLVFITKNNVSAERECERDTDCVPANCCHPNSCVPREEAPDCSAVSCTAECAPNTLDCGQGYCGCVNSKCSAVFPN